MSGGSHVRSVLSESASPSCSWEAERRAGVVEERGKRADTNESLNETLLRSG